MLPHIHTNDGLTVIIRGRPYSVARDHKAYDEAVALLRDGTEGEFEDLLTRVARVLETKLHLTSDMVYSGGVVMYQGEVLHNYATDRLISMIDTGLDHAPLSRFLAKLQDNPSKRVVDNLYAFLEHGSIPLTDDGDFMAYKAVRADFHDTHSGRFFNGVGTTCCMPRNKVDEDPDRTCSSGLHVCSFDYLPHFANTDGHVMMCKINPADVVAIPADYNNTKMRVSKYVVVGEVHNYYADRVDVLGDVGRDSGVLEPLFTVLDEDSEEQDQTYTLEEAKIIARKVYDGTGRATYVEDSEGFVVFEYNGN